MELLKYPFALLLLLASNLSFAGLITYGDYTLDEDTNIVTNTVTGLEWLQWDETTGTSISTALSTIATTFDGGGWELASNTQMAGLFDDFGFSSTVLDQSNPITSGPFTPNTDETAYDIFITLLGTTFFCDTSCSDNYASGSLAFERTQALYGSDADGDDLYKVALVQSDFLAYSTSLGTWLEQGYTAELSNDAFSPQTTFLSWGVALVRSDDVPVPAPAPSTLAIFALGILGLGVRRRARG
ncbi:MAG: PEP-CTERM sorting domain-containing protein [Aestuariibacter sp.]|nr:PEP-CTERM sorting domain-containing protein [Aestuariibacter sp.]MCP4238614.1 PEP-CTERM sorting domain-containing protein [Aestuariibacter sp.]MCP4525103.1 PEP-CTERM sorting domain-containing protein [Aestuariibacter sp.]